MRRLRILVPALAVATLALGAIATNAFAEGGGHQRHRGGGGSTLPGVLEASGDGIAAASGKLTLKLCAEDGLVLTKGGVTVTEGEYEDTVSWLGLNVYFGFSGCATIGPESAIWEGFSEGGSGGGGGGKTAALAVGTGLQLRAVGTGIAFLSGEGEWSDSNGQTGAWTGEVMKIGGKKQNCNVEALSGGGGGGSKCPTPTPDPDPTEEPTEEPDPTATPTEEI